MAKLLVAFVSILSCAVAQAEWLDFGRGEDFQTYIDTSTYQRTANGWTVWALQDFDQTETFNGHRYRSLIALQEFDCKNRRSRTLGETQYSGRMGGGKVVFSDQGAGSWRLTIPGTVGKNQIDIVCAAMTK